MAVKHAVLSASSSERWLNCPPSARLCEAYEDKGSDYAAEGTDAHSLCEFRLKQALGIPADDPIENLSWYNEEMEDCAAKGVEVSAVDNPQMMLYALGALEIFDGIYDIDSVRMTIYQPRKSNISVCVMEKDGLLEWAQNDLTYKAKLAYEGGGDFRCGEWCRFCKAKAECRERAEANLALVRYDFEEPPLLTDEEIADILDKVDALTAWAADVKEYALQKAVSGTAFPGWKLVEGRSNRKYTSESAVAVAVESAGFEPYEKKLLGITALQKLLGKSRFEELLAPYIEKPQGKPTLVRSSDKRPEWNTAKNDFMEEL